MAELVAVRDALVPGARNFRWGEFSGWDKATPLELERLRRLVVEILQPVRDHFGRPVIISAGGWLYSRWGWRRGRAHGLGAAGDFNVQGVAPYDVWEWIGLNLGGPPARFGEAIEERTHVHVTLPGFGGNGEFLREPTEGTYVAYDPRDPSRPLGSAFEGVPVDVPGLSVVVAGGPTWLWWGIFGGLLILRFRR